MHQVEGRLPFDRGANGIFVEVEIPAERVNESRDILLRDGHDQVDVLGCSGNAVQRAGQRATDEIWQPKLLTYPGQVQRDDEDVVHDPGLRWR